MKFYNSLTHQIEEFRPIHPGIVGFYSCGPTVYDFAHIGNLRTIILYDLIKRVLLFDGYTVQHVMNITDVGHLASDADTGEDKMEQGATTANEVFAIAQKYTQNYLDDLQQLNIILPTKLPKASDHISEQIQMIQTLIDNGFAYESEEAVYFNVLKFPEYNRLVGQNLDDMLLGARQEVVHDPKKKNPADFVLWFKTVNRYEYHILRWPSPWGPGFPGWHIECSAMANKYLGKTFDIHAGGIDLKFPHHANEIAQSTSANNQPMANYWIHGEHLSISDAKMSKSKDNFYTLETLTNKGFNPLAFRYLVLTAHYQSKLNFSFDSLTAAQNALNNLYAEISTLPASGHVAQTYLQQFTRQVNNNLETPQALATMWELLKSNSEPADKLATLIEFDKILGLSIKQIWQTNQIIPTEVQELIKARDDARENKDFDLSDQLRDKIESAGYLIEDNLTGSKVKKKF